MGGWRTYRADSRYVGHRLGRDAMIGLRGAAVVGHPAAGMVQNAAALALQNGFAILEGSVAERAESL